MLVLNPLNWQDLNTSSWYVVNCLNFGHLRGTDRGEKIKIRSACLLKLISKAETNDSWSSSAKFTCSRPQTNGCHDEPDLTLFRSDFPPWITPDSRGSILVKVSFTRCHSCGDKDQLCWELWNLHHVCYPCIVHGKTAAPFRFGRGKDGCCNSYDCGRDPSFLVEKEADEIYELACSLYEKRRRC